MIPIQSVGVVGGGLMGSGIAEVAARAGLTVRVVEVHDSPAQAAEGRISNSLRRAESRGRLGAGESALARRLITVSSDLNDIAD